MSEFHPIATKSRTVATLRFRADFVAKVVLHW
jgi:hypothetical protein